MRGGCKFPTIILVVFSLAIIRCCTTTFLLLVVEAREAHQMPQCCLLYYRNMIVVACNATLYQKACSSALYSYSSTLDATTQKLALILMSITLKGGFNIMADAQTLAFHVM